MIIVMLFGSVAIGALCGFVFARARALRSEFVFREMALGGIGALAGLLVTVVVTHGTGTFRWWSVLVAIAGAAVLLAVHRGIAAARGGEDESAPNTAYLGKHEHQDA